MRPIFTLLLCCFSSLAFSQDPHFSLFDSHPMLINPAFTGDMPDDYRMRLGVQHRHQWFDALNDYYNHTAFAFDSATPLCFSNATDMTFSPGFYYLQERFPISGKSPRLFSQKLGATLAIRMKLNDEIYFAVGFEGELLQRQLRAVDGLQFGIQYDGMGGFDSQASSQEGQIPLDGNLSSGIKPDLGTGLALVIRLGHRNALRLGGAMHHIQRPNLSLLGNEEDDDADISRRLTAYYRLKFGTYHEQRNRIDNYAEFQLAGAYVRQGIGIWEFNQRLEMGGHIQDNFFSFSAGVRMTNARVSSGDAVTDLILAIRWYKNPVVVELGTDFALSPFANIGNDNTATALELSVSYLLLRKSKSSRCAAMDCPYF